jgi:AhpD family alkylhydroperoxidase
MYSRDALLNEAQSMIENWPETAKILSGELKNLRTGAPDVMKAFSAVAQAALAPKALDTKTKELIALAVSVAVRCDDCVAFHSKAAVQQGATRDEVLETLSMAIYMGAGPSVMYASHALGAFDQFAAAKEA